MQRQVARNSTNSLLFNGTSSIVSGIVSPARTAGQPLTFGCVVRTIKGGTIMGARTGSSAGALYKLELSTTGVPAAQYDPTGSGATVTGTANINDGLWHQLVGRYDGTNLSLWVDGVKVNQSTTILSAAIVSTSFAYGRRSDSVVEYYSGFIDSAFVSPTAWTDQEILDWSLTNRLANKTASFYHLFNTGSGTVLVDSLGNTNGTITNATWSTYIPTQLRSTTFNRAIVTNTFNPANTLIDNFTGADGTSIASHTPDTVPSGSVWSQTAGTSFYIQGNLLVPNRFITNDMAVIDAKSTMYTIQCTMSSYILSGNLANACLVFRYQDANNYWYCEINVNAQLIKVVEVLAGTLIPRITHAATLTSAVPVAIRIDCWNANITLWVDGVEIVTHCSTDMQTATFVGVRLIKSLSPVVKPTWDNFSVTAYQGTPYNWPVFVKNPNNPVVPKGTAGAWDETDVNDPVVMLDSANNRLVMQYSGYSNGGTAPGTRVQHLGLAFAQLNNVANNNWVKYVGNPVMTANGGDGIYAFNGGFCKFNGLWYQAYCSNNGSQINMATSPDLITWTRVSTIVSPTVGTWTAAGAFDPYLRLRQDGVTLELWYAGASNSGATRALGYATSIDGTTWVQNPGNPVITTKSWGAQSSSMGEPSIFVPAGKEGKEMLVSYDTALAASGANRMISQALTVDGGVTWKYRTGVGMQSSGWESAQNFDSCIYQDGNNLYLFYGGADIAGLALNLDIQVGVAAAYWPYDSLLATGRQTTKTRGLVQ